MTYQVLARKWRPQDFDSVVGQEPIVTALRNALREHRIAQAYMFSGIRGVGKTTVARIMAKALNCERGIENGPCNECPTCLEVTSGASLDILEIDAATHSKVEQVRELTENLKYKPVHGRYKVVVLDEVHRLSRQAFDALLKIVEEPPEHLVFIFATTELEAVPATILSRCQEFNFRRVARDPMVAHLRQLADAEEITVGDKTLLLIARASEGSVRDAVALLDQLATYSSGTIDDDEAGRILGGVDAALHLRLLGAVTGGDRSTVVEVVAEIEQQGWDPRHVYGEFLGYCRDALHLALGADIGQIELPDDEARALAELASKAGYENLLRLLHQLLASEEPVRRSEAGLLAVEIAWLRGAELPHLTTLEALLSGSPPPTASKTPDNPPPAAPEDTEATPPTASASAPVTDDPPASNNNGSSESTENAAGSPRGIDGFIELIGRRRQVLAAHLADVQGLDFDDECLTITTPPGDSWLELALRRDANREAFESCLETAFGTGSRWRLLAGSEPTTTAEPEAATAAGQPPAEPEPDVALAHPTVQAALDVFGGTAETVDEA